MTKAACLCVFTENFLAEERRTRLNLTRAAGTCCWPTDLQNAGLQNCSKKEEIQEVAHEGEG